MPDEIVAPKERNLRVKQEHSLGPYVVDYYYPTLRIAVDLSTRDPELYHHKLAFLRSLGIRIIQVDQPPKSMDDLHAQVIAIIQDIQERSLNS